MTPEGRVKEKVKVLLRRYVEHGLWYFMPSASGYGQHGVPDFIVCFGGLMLAIECKASKGMPTALQKLQMSELTKAGAMVFLVRDEEDLQAVEADLNLILTKEIHETAADK